MKVLMINKFLYQKRGAETYMLQLGKKLSEIGHEVQYFGMDDEKRSVSNNVNSYTNNMDFHSTNIIDKLSYGFNVIYSKEARKKIRLVLDDFKPDVCHLNNFNYQLTPSIILEIARWRKENNRKCKIVYTAHDCQLICPNHMLYIPNKKKTCTKCIYGDYWNCFTNNCIHNDLIKSLFGTLESIYWHKINTVYEYIDQIICPSNFTKDLLDNNNQLINKTITLYNFIDKIQFKEIKDLVEYKKYVLYFGSYTEEKGVDLLVEVCKQLPKINFVFAGAGPLETKINTLHNAINLGYCTGDKLYSIIQNAYFVVNPTKVYETYGLTNVESIYLITPVIASKIGGIPEAIGDDGSGILFEANNKNELCNLISELWNNQDRINKMKEACSKHKHIFVSDYIENLLRIYNNN